MKNIISAILLLSLFTACQNAPSKDGAQATAIDEKSAPDLATKRYIGLLSHGSAGTFFRPCGRDSTRWAVIDSTDEAIDLYKKNISIWL